MDGSGLARAIESERHRRLMGRVAATGRRHAAFRRAAAVSGALALAALAAMALVALAALAG